MNVLRIPELTFLFLRYSRNPWMTPDGLRRYQLARLSSLIDHAFRCVPYYREEAKRRGLRSSHVTSLDRLSLLPIITRRSVQEARHLFHAEWGRKDGWFRSKSSGSTGEPLEVCFDPRSWLVSRYVLKWRSLRAMGFSPLGRVAIVRAMEPGLLEEQWRTLRLPLERWAGRRRYLSTFEAPERHLEFYRRFRPHAIHGPPSYFMALAEAAGGRMEACLRVPRILCTTELLDARSRQTMKERFGADVFDIYGNTEFKDVAWECPAHEGYHINADNLIVEIVQDGVPVPPGGEGDILLTTLTNRAMPLIRYQVGDRGVLSEGTCSCGRSLPLMKAVTGRLVDYIRFPDGRRMSPYELVNLLEEIPGLRRFQIHQRDDFALDLNLVVSEGAGGPVAARVQEVLRSKVGLALPLRVHMVDQMPVSAGQKFRLVLSDLSRSDKV
jgi:phenylacetate-CoA ligase